MYRGNIEIRKCKKCGKSYEQQRGTLAMKSRSFNVCLYCGGDTEYDHEKNRERIEEIKEGFQKLYRITEMHKKV